MDGVILDSAGSASDAQARTLESVGIPIVLLDRVIGNRSSRYGVFVDNQLGAREAALHLLAREACSLVYINGPAQLSQSIERLSGVEAALREMGVAPDRLRILAGDFTLESGWRLTASLIEAQRAERSDRRLAFNAIFAANDLMAIGALRALRQAGLAAPDDVEVIGFDDIEFARMAEPPLSTVAQPAQEMGAMSAELLLRLIAGQKPRRKTVLMTPRLVLRGTTRARPRPRRTSDWRENETMENFEFRNPTKIVFGRGAEERSASKRRPTPRRSCCTTAAAASRRPVCSIASHVVAQGRGVEWVELGGVKPNPRLSLVHEGVRLCKDDTGSAWFWRSAAAA